MATGDDLADLKIVMKEFVADLRHIFTNMDEQRDLLIIQLFSKNCHLNGLCII